MSAIHLPLQQHQQHQYYQQGFENSIAEAATKTNTAQRPINQTMAASSSSTSSALSACVTNMQSSTKPKKKRLNHNELERKRRHHQREVLYELRDVIPNLHMVKPSTVLIMQKSKEYIDLLRRTIQEMEAEINDLRRALVAAGYPLPMPNHQQQQQQQNQQQPMICGFPNNQPPFGSSCHSPQLLSEQLLAVGSQGHMTIDTSAQIPFHGLSELSLSRTHFDQHSIENITHLHSVLGKEVQSLATCTARPISPVSPYQLEHIQGCSSGEFKKQTDPSILKESSHENDIIMAAAAVAAAASGSAAQGITTTTTIGSHF